MKENSKKKDMIQHDINTVFVNSKQMAKMCFVTTRTITNWRNKGLISFYQIGNSVFYRVEDVQELLGTVFVSRRAS